MTPDIKAFLTEGMKAIKNLPEFDADSFFEAVQRAKELCLEDAKFWTWRDGTALTAKEDLTSFRNAIETASKAWAKVPDDSRRELSRFVSADAPDQITPKLSFIQELLTEFQEHYFRDGGRPPRGEETGNDIRPLISFVRVIHGFWIANTDQPFGHRMERVKGDFGRGKSNDARGHNVDPTKDHVALSPSMKLLFLLCYRADLGLPKKYPLPEIRTAVQRIKKEADKGT